MGRLRLIIFVVFFLFFILGFSYSLNREGLALLKFKDKVVVDPFGALSNWEEDDGSTDPCSWSGIGCWNGKVVTLDLRDLCLMGTLAPEIGDLGYLKFIILRNNSFFGSIPEEIKELKELEVLDIGYNNFSGLFPADFGNDISLTTLLLDNNQFLGSIAPELEELKLLSEFQVDKNLLDDGAMRPSCNVDGAFVWNAVQHGNTADRRRLQEVPDYKSPFQAHTRDRQRFPSPSPPPSSFPMTHFSAPLPAVSPGSPVSSPTASFSAAPSPLYSPFSSPSASPTSSISSPATSHSTRPIPVLPAPVLQAEPAKSARAPQSFSASYPNQTAHKGSSSKHHRVLLLIGTIGGFLLLLVPVICMVFCRSTKVVTVRPWTTGLSGQLQKAFVTGVPNLRRSELEAACEDFSNIIGSFSDGTIYKGTLSSGVEIAVTSFVATSSKAWSKDLETRFRNKIEELSKVNHKNFVNLIGYCEEDEPFTRMMVFEYAPNGTLFEHLHVKEAEHLDWATRIRIAVGMAYCLEHMHQLVPAIALRNLQSSSVFLTEDYAAKIADFCFWSSASNDKMGSTAKEHIDNLSASLESNAYSFGLILLEMMTGRIPYSKSNIADWAMDRLSRRQPVKEIVDPTLKTFNENEFEKLFEVIKSCVHPDPRERLTMGEITRKLKEITEMGPDGATPKHSPLWWAELEIMSEAE